MNKPHRLLPGIIRDFSDNGDFYAKAYDFSRHELQCLIDQVGTHYPTSRLFIVLPEDDDHTSLDLQENSHVMYAWEEDSLEDIENLIQVL